MPEETKTDSESQSRIDLATKIIKEYDTKAKGNRDQIEEEVRRIAYPLGTSDHESDEQEYVSEDSMFDTTVRTALVTAKNGIMSRMFPFSNKWFAHKFTQTDDTQDAEKHSRALEKIGDLQFRQLGQDNFYGAMSDSLDDYLNFGTNNIKLKKGKRRFAHFEAVTKSKYKFALDDEGFPDIVWVYYKLTAYEIKTMFGERGLTQKIAQSIKDERVDDRYEIINKVTRRSEFKPENAGVVTADPPKREFESVWVSKQDKDLLGDATMPRRKVIYKDGLYFNPYTIARLMSRAGQSEGEGLTTMMLPAIRTANSKASNIERAENLAVDPPWYQDESNPIGDEARVPGGTVNRDPFSPESAPAPIPMPSDGIQWEKAGLAEIRADIKEAFFYNAFKMFTNMDVATNRKTAFESRLIKAEQTSLLISLLYGLAEESVKVLLSKHLNMMIREGKIPDSVLADLPADYEIELTSQFAKSIENTQAEDLMTALEMALQIEQVVPGTAKSTVKWNQSFHKVLQNLEIDIDDLYTLEESSDLMQKELDRQSAMMDAQIANQGADALSKIQSN